MMAITTGMQYTPNNTLPIIGYDQISPHGQPSREPTTSEREALEATSSDFLADKVTCKHNINSIKDEIMTNLDAVQGLSPDCQDILKKRGLEVTPVAKNQRNILFGLIGLPFTFFAGYLLETIYHRFASRQSSNQVSREEQELLSL